MKVWWIWRNSIASSCNCMRPRQQQSCRSDWGRSCGMSCCEAAALTSSETDLMPAANYGFSTLCVGQRPLRRLVAAELLVACHHVGGHRHGLLLAGVVTGCVVARTPPSLLKVVALPLEYWWLSRVRMAHAQAGR